MRIASYCWNTIINIWTPVALQCFLGELSFCIHVNVYSIVYIHNLVILNLFNFFHILSFYVMWPVDHKKESLVERDRFPPRGTPRDPLEGPKGPLVSLGFAVYLLVKCCCTFDVVFSLFKCCTRTALLFSFDLIKLLHTHTYCFLLLHHVYSIQQFGRLIKSGCLSTLCAELGAWGRFHIYYIKCY